LGELGTIWRYPYWSDRRVRGIAADSNIDLSSRLQLGITSPALLGAPQLQLTREPAAVQRHEMALRLERSIGQLAVEDLATPPPARFVKGRGPITFAAYTRCYPEAAYLRQGSSKRKARTKGVVIHTHAESSDGTRVEICLFASIENCAGFLLADQAPAPGWSSSSSEIIEEFLAFQGKRTASLYDDDESIAVEILRTINNQGMTDSHVFKRIDSADCFAEVYHDVVLDHTRWNLEPCVDVPRPVDRIVIAAPLWVRSDGS